jgi:hypothetical protein
MLGNSSSGRNPSTVLTRRGTSAIHVIREAVVELESAWAKELGATQFSELRSLLVQLNKAAS